MSGPHDLHSPLRDLGAVFVVSAVSALALTIAFVFTEVKRQRWFITNQTEAVNEFIVESTGDPTSRITVERFRQLIEFGGKLPLSINGVPCLEIKATGDRTADRKIVATVTAPTTGSTASTSFSGKRLGAQFETRRGPVSD